MRFATIDQATGFVTAILETKVEDNLYFDGAVIFGYLYKDIAGAGLSNEDLLKSYFSGGEFITKPDRPSKHHVWNLDTGSWLEPGNYVDILKAESLPLINSLAGKKILNRLPQWKQSNLSARAAELIVIDKANWTSEESEEFTAIQSEWNWVKSIRALSNNYYADVTLASTAERINALMNKYKAELTGG
jgi:hypothetical protein